MGAPRMDADSTASVRLCGSRLCMIGEKNGRRAARRTCAIVWGKSGRATSLSFAVFLDALGV
eukprot:12416235-Alexandrium_andersonii.AAC.1